MCTFGVLGNPSVFGAAGVSHDSPLAEVELAEVEHPRSIASRFLQRLVSSPRSSACCSSDVSGALYPCPRQVAGVAVHSIHVATTAQLVGTQGFWAGGVFLSRALQHACAERLG